MKLKHFLAIVIGVACAGIFLAIRACAQHTTEAPKKLDESHVSDVQPPVTHTDSPPAGSSATAPGSAATPPPAGPVDLQARPYDAEVLAWKDRTIPGNKEKDVSKGKAYKVSVYRDDGQTNVNRAKVDANRNDKWDDKYTFAPGTITLQHAPKDDEQYTETYHWTGTGWAKEP